MLHPGLQLFHRSIGRLGKLVVGITSQHLVLVLEILLEKLQPLTAFRGQPRKLDNVILGSAGHLQRCRPHEFRRINSHDQERRADLTFTKINRLDGPGFTHQFLALQNRYHLEERLGNLFLF